MTEEKDKIKVVFAPEFFEDFEGTQEELDELIKAIMDSIEDGTFLEKSRPIEDLEDEDPEEYEDFMEVLSKRGRSGSTLLH